MIKICKLPTISQHENKWGQPTGEYYVRDACGSIEKSMWKDVQAFEGYHNTPEGQAEQAQAKKDIESGVSFDKINMPIMKKVLGKAHGQQLWQMNLLVKRSDDDQTNEYIRSYALFGKVEFSEWTQAHDDEVKKLQKQVDKLNE